MFPTIRQLLEIDEAKEISVEACEELISQTTFHDVMSSEGAESWKSAEYGEIFLTSGTEISSGDELSELIKDLGKKGAIPLIHLGGAVEQIPDDIRHYCKENGIILLSVPSAARMQPLVRKIYELIFQEEKQSRTNAQIMRHLIDGNYDNEEAERAYQMGIESGSRFVAVMIVLDNSEKIHEDYSDDQVQDILRNVSSTLEYLLRVRGRELRFSVIEEGSLICLIRNDGDYLDRAYYKELFHELMYRVGRKYGALTVSVGIGSLFSEISEVQRAVTEARRSLQIARACGRTKVVRCFDDMGIYRLLFELQDYEVFLNIENGILGKLKQYDLENGENLVETLRIYLKNDKNIGMSAQEMYLHRNTFKYRLNKIEDILLCDLTDPNTCFNINLAFKIELFLQSEKAYLK